MAPKQEEKIKINTVAELQSHFQSIKFALSEPETEDSWKRLDKTLAKLEQVTKGGGYKFDEFVKFLKDKEVCDPIINSLLSERTSLSGTCADLLQSIAPRLSDRFESLIPIYIPPLLSICSKTNKVALKRSEKTLLLISKHCKLVSLIPYFLISSKDKKAIFSLRTISLISTITLLETDLEKERFSGKVGGGGGKGKGKDSDKVSMIEEMIKVTATDSNSEVRSKSKELFKIYVEKWPERVERFTTPFTPTIRRYLALPKTGGFRPENAPLLLPSSSSSSSSTTISDSSSLKPNSNPPKDSQMTESELMIRNKRNPNDGIGGSSSVPSTSASSSRLRDQIQEVRSKNKMESTNGNGGIGIGIRIENGNGERKEREREFSSGSNTISISSSSRNDSFFNPSNSQSNTQHSNHHLFSNPHPQNQHQNHNQNQNVKTNSSISQPQNDIFKQFAGGFSKGKNHMNMNFLGKSFDKIQPPTISPDLNLILPDEEMNNREAIGEIFRKEKKSSKIKREDLKRSLSSREIKDQEILSKEENQGIEHHNQMFSSDSNGLKKAGKEREIESERIRSSQTERIEIRNLDLNPPSSSSSETSSKNQLQGHDADDDNYSKNSFKNLINPSEKLAMRFALQNSKPTGASRQRSQDTLEEEEEHDEIHNSNPNSNLMKTPGLKAARIQLKITAENSATLKKAVAGRVLSKEQQPISQPIFKNQNQSKIDSLMLIPNSSKSSLSSFNKGLPNSAPPNANFIVEKMKNEIEKPLEIIANDSADSTPSGSPKSSKKLDSDIQISIDDDEKKVDEIKAENQSKESAESKAKLESELESEDKVKPSTMSTISSSNSKKVVKDNKVAIKPSASASSKKFVPTRKVTTNPSSTSSISNVVNKSKPTSTTTATAASSSSAISSKPLTLSNKQPLKSSTNQINSKLSSSNKSNILSSKKEETKNYLSKSISSKPSTLSKSTSTNPSSTVTTTTKPKPKTERLPLHAPKPSNVRSKVEPTINGRKVSSSSSTSNGSTKRGFMPKGKIVSSISNRNLGARNLALGKSASSKDVVGSNKKISSKEDPDSKLSSKVTKKVITGSSNKTKDLESKKSVDGMSSSSSSSSSSKVVEEINDPSIKSSTDSGIKKFDQLTYPVEVEEKESLIQSSEDLERPSSEEKKSEELSISSDVHQTLSKEKESQSVPDQMLAQLQESSIQVETGHVDNLEIKTDLMEGNGSKVENKVKELETDERKEINPSSSSSSSGSRPKAMRILSSDVDESEDEGEKKSETKIDLKETSADDVEEIQKVEEEEEKVEQVKILNHDDVEDSEGLDEKVEEPNSNTSAEDIDEEEGESSGKFQDDNDIQETLIKAEENSGLNPMDEEPQHEDITESLAPQISAESLEDQPKKKVEETEKEDIKEERDQDEEANESLETVKNVLSKDESMDLSQDSTIDEEINTENQNLIDDKVEETQEEEEKTSDVEKLRMEEKPFKEEKNFINSNLNPPSNTNSTSTSNTSVSEKEDFFISRNPKEGGKIQLICRGSLNSESFSDSYVTDTDDIPTSPFRGGEFSNERKNQTLAESEDDDEMEVEREDERIEIEKGSDQQEQQHDLEQEEQESSFSQPQILLKRQENKSSRPSVASSLGDESSIFEDDSVLMV